MAGLIPGSKLVVVPDCGHLSTLERPEAVTQALMAWMK
jgi:pimeloyl-ACP methyl ester carboxylesterase